MRKALHLLESADLEIIRQCRLQVRKRVAGLSGGEQRSTALGGGIEFADYREYQPGDDLRMVDWSLYLRLKTLMIKLSAEEKELTLMVVLDTSRSMYAGNPDKSRFARRIAGILAGIAMEAGNRAGIAATGHGLRIILAPENRRSTLPFADALLGRLLPDHTANHKAALTELAARYGRRCLTVYVSDLMYDGWQESLSVLVSAGWQAVMLHVLSADEYAPTMEGETTLCDLETAETIPLHVGSSVREQYNAALNDWLSDIERFCHGKGILHVPLSSDRAMSTVFMQDLRKAGLTC